MLKQKTLSLAITTFLSLPVVFSSMATAQPICGALSESALFMMDYSGSMMKADEEGNRAIEQSKQLLLKVTKSMPQEAELAMGVISFAPHAILIPPQIYSYEGLSEKVEKLPDNMEVMGRHTNLGEGLMGYKNRVERLSASQRETEQKLAHKMSNDARLIILTDGGEDNRGRSVKEVIGEFTNSLPNVQLTIISFAQDQNQQNNLLHLAEGNAISLYNGRDLLQNPHSLEQFIRTELYFPCDEIKFTLSSDVLFGFDQSHLTTDGLKALQEVANSLKKTKRYLMLVAHA